ncbi:MAG: hypothetical protein KKD00_04935 [Gammaproteobacteria bacterium]|nr:hypothetical protein [Gammaproteobacteria bacterium]
MRELSAMEINQVSGGDQCTWDVVAGYVGATVAFTMVTGPVSFAFAAVMWYAAATSMDNSC